MNPFAVEAKIRDLADRAAMEFLSPLSEKRASPDWIAKNAEKILAESGKDLTVIVTKIASDENLNPHEIARVCEESNKEVFARLYRSSGDKTFEFKVADASGVLKTLNQPYEGPGDIYLPVEHPKLAKSAMFGREKAEKGSKGENLFSKDVYAMAEYARVTGKKITREEWERAGKPHLKKSASWASSALYPSDGQAMVLSLDEEKTAYDSFRELKLEAKAAQNQAALDFLKMARDLVLEGQRTPSELFAMAKEARPGKPLHEKAARELLALVALDTGAKFPEGADLVVKYAKDILGEVNPSETGGGDQPSDDLRTVTQESYDFWTKSPGARPDELASGVSSSGGDPVRFINGRHALFMTLDTLVDQTGKENSWAKGLLVAGDRVRSTVRNVVNWTPKSENV